MSNSYYQVIDRITLNNAKSILFIRFPWTPEHPARQNDILEKVTARANCVQIIPQLVELFHHNFVSLLLLIIIIIIA